MVSKKGVSHRSFFIFSLVIVMLFVGIGILGLFGDGNSLTGLTTSPRGEGASGFSVFLIVGIVALLIAIVFLLVREKSG